MTLDPGHILTGEPEGAPLRLPRCGVVPDERYAGGAQCVPLSSLPPRLLRPRAAANYLGMNKNSFNRLVRPRVFAIPLGKRAIAFDRLELDAWIEEYCVCNGRPVREEGQLCRENTGDLPGLT